MNHTNEEVERVAEEARKIYTRSWDGGKSIAQWHLDKISSLQSENKRLREALVAISEYDGQPIWNDDRDDAAQDMLDIAAKSLIK